MRHPGRRSGPSPLLSPRGALYGGVLVCMLPLVVLMLRLLSDLYCTQSPTACRPVNVLPEFEDDASSEAHAMEPADTTLQSLTLLNTVTPPDISLDAYLADRPRAAPLIVALTNLGYADMAANFLCSLRRLNLTNTLMFATDVGSYAYLTQRGFPVFHLNSSKSQAGATWGSKAFNIFVKEKVRAVLAVVSLGFEVLFCDLDMVWKRAALVDALQSAALADRLPEVDGRTVGSLEGVPHADGSGWDYAIYYYKAHSNTGFYYMRSNNRTRQLMRNWLECCGRVPVDDQDTFDGLTDLHLHGKRLSRIKYVWARCKDLRLFLRRVLLSSREYFPNGSDFFVLRYPQRARVTPFLLHANQIPGGKRAKIKVMREFKEWLLDDTGQCQL
eukprot:GGOE01061792.1.p1 GENE.GGOE01061792.1~~GGOE01061792.1.p1  ORF type:complete len:386 (+),score=125.86 GGOE01061792.1:93-1250(+)